MEKMNSMGEREGRGHRTKRTLVDILSDDEGEGDIAKGNNGSAITSLLRLITCRQTLPLSHCFPPADIATSAVD